MKFTATHAAKYHPLIDYRNDDKFELMIADLLVESRGKTLLVPRGFVSDLSSIPRPLWWLIAPFELCIAAPLVHDWLYQNNGKIFGAHAVDIDIDNGPPANLISLDRAETNLVFADLMQQDDVIWWRRKAAYVGVDKFSRRWTPDPL